VIVRDLTDSRHADIVLWYDGSSEWKGAVKVLINTGVGW
jgi:hypothetical protein